LGLYLKFTFNKIPFYSGFGLDRFNIGLHLYINFTFNKIPFYSGFGLDRFNIGLHLYINYFLTDYDENRLLSLDITDIINGEYISVNH